MAEPTFVETSEDAFLRAAAAGIALKRDWPATRAEERVRDAALVGQAQRLVGEARRVIAANRANGNGHALALAQPAGGEQLTKGQPAALAKGLCGWLDPELRALEKRLLHTIAQELGKALGERDRLIAELKARSTMKYEGVWAAEKVYNVGDFVTDQGSLWHCWDANCGVRPGSSDAWQLAVRKGRDGRDAKGNR
jgi:hypothetical protein